VLKFSAVLFSKIEKLKEGKPNTGEDKQEAEPPEEKKKPRPLGD